MSNAVGIAAALASAALVSSEGGVVLDPPDVARIMELKRQGWGSKRIAQELVGLRGDLDAREATADGDEGQHAAALLGVRLDRGALKQVAQSIAQVDDIAHGLGLEAVFEQAGKA